jgi:hypothetical protein
MHYALQVLPDADHDGQFHWVVLEEHPDGGGQFTPHSAGECGFDSYEAALNAGTLALAAADGQPYENEATDSVGDADCAQPIGPAAYVSRANPRAAPKRDAPRPGQTSNRYGSKAS